MASSLLVRNVGPVDRVLRVALGVGLVAMALTGRGAWGWVGIVPILTGSLGSCPAYLPFGLSTCTRKA